MSTKKISSVYFGDDDYEIDRLEKYIQIGGQFLTRIFDQLVTEDAISFGDGVPRLTNLPCWFEILEFLVPFSVIATMEHPNYIDYETLQILMFAKETSVRKTDNSGRIVHSFALFGNENEEDEDDEFCDNYQTIILSKFLKMSSPKLTHYLQAIIVRILGRHFCSLVSPCVLTPSANGY